MTSAINPQNIDGAYPVAGQDNDSQGFRDNFTNIKTNFAFAAAEITDLQNNVVLKAPLTGIPFNNNMGGQVLINAQLRDISGTVVSGFPTSGLVSLNYENGSYQKIGNTTGSVNVSFANFPPPGQVGTLRLQITISDTDPLHTLTVTPTGALPLGLINLNVPNLDTSTGVITFVKPGTYEYEFQSTDGGSTISIFSLNANDPLLLPDVQLFAANGNISTQETTTVITSSNNLIGNLAAGSAGQIKILAYGNASTGNCLVTVTNSAWGGSNLANLSAVGSAAAFQYINSKWFCVGNNGVTFS
jgi:hypothetical protein